MLPLPNAAVPQYASLAPTTIRSSENGNGPLDSPQPTGTMPKLLPHIETLLAAPAISAEYPIRNGNPKTLGFPVPVTEHPTLNTQHPTPETQGTEVSPTAKPFSPMRKLKQLKKMMEAGLITEEDYETKKADILSRI
jgi:hypothetical protein